MSKSELAGGAKYWYCKDKIQLSAVKTCKFSPPLSCGMIRSGSRTQVLSALRISCDMGLKR